MTQPTFISVHDSAVAPTRCVSEGLAAASLARRIRAAELRTVLLRLIAPALLFTLLVGCRGGHKFSKHDLGRARAALETCLDSWKKGEMPDKLRSLAEPIEFAEEGPRNGLKLVSYEITGTEHTDAEMMRFSVKLTVQDRKGKTEERRATYAVALKTPIAVGRDPMF